MHREEITVRQAVLDDVASVLDLWSVARTSRSQTPDTHAGVERLLVDEPGALLVAESAGRLVGTLIAAWDGWRGNMYRLAVEPGFRRRGVATCLVQAGEQRLRSVGAPRISALVAHEDAVARAFWSAAGYNFDDGTGRFVRNT